MKRPLLMSPYHSFLFAPMYAALIEVPAPTNGLRSYVTPAL